MAGLKSTLAQLLKLLLVAALMYWVASGVQWQDQANWTGADDAVVRVQAGHIVGPWQENVVRFVPEGQVEELQLVRGPQQDGTSLDVAPGFVTYWRTMDLVRFGAGAFCFFLCVMMSGMRWWWLLRINGLGVTLPEALRFTWIGMFFNSVVPGATGGDVIKALYIMKRCPGKRIPALVSVFVDRILGLGSLAILGAVVVLFALDRFATLALAIWSVMGGVLLLGCIAFSKRLRQVLRIKPMLERLPPRLGNTLKLVDEAVHFYRGHKAVLALSLLSGIGNHVFFVASVALMGDALGIGMPWFEYFVLIPIINVVSAVPIAPNGWGVGEALYKTLFSTYGGSYVEGVANPGAVMGTRGVALSVLFRLHMTLWSLLGGLFVLLERDRVTRADVEREVAMESGRPDRG